MKYLLTLLLLLSLGASAQSVADLDAKNGFRDTRLGMPIGEIKGLVLLENDGDDKFYKRPSDQMSIGAGRLTAIVYGFYKGRLSSVRIECVGIANSEAVLKTLIASYGKGNQSNEYIEKWYWFGEKVVMSFEENAINHDGVMRISSNEIRELRKIDDEAKAKASKGDL